MNTISNGEAVWRGTFKKKKKKNTYMLKPNTLLWTLLPHTYIYTG
jgi:hypothetical protein